MMYRKTPQLKIRLGESSWIMLIIFNADIKETGTNRAISTSLDFKRPFTFGADSFFSGAEPESNYNYNGWGLMPFI